MRRSKRSLAAIGVLVLLLAGVGLWSATPRKETPPIPPIADAQPQPELAGLVLEFPAYCILLFDPSDTKRENRNAPFRVRCPEVPKREPGHWSAITAGWNTFNSYNPSVYTLPVGSVDVAADGRETPLPDGTRVIPPGTKPENEKPVRQIHPRPAVEEKPKPEDRPEPLRSQPVAADAKPGTLVLMREGDYQFLTPEGREVLARRPAGESRSVRQSALSPDGKAVAVAVIMPDPVDKSKGAMPRSQPSQFRHRVEVSAFDAAEPSRTWDVMAATVQMAWAADGKSVVLTKWLSHAPPTIENVRLDLATGKSEVLDLPPDSIVLDCSRNGKVFVAAWPVVGPKDHYYLGLVEVGKKQPRVLTEVELHRTGPLIVGRLSPDEATILFLDSDPGRTDAYRWRHSFSPFLIGVRTGIRAAVEGMPETGRAFAAAWSPDGKRIAYASWNIPADILKQQHQVFDHNRETETVVVVADASGRNAKTIASQKGPNAIGSPVQSAVVQSIDWR